VQVAVVDAADADPQPEMVVPSSLKFTEPARGTVAVIAIAPPSAALVALFGRAIEIEDEALLIVMVKDLVPTWLLPSVARTVCEYVPADTVFATETVVPDKVTPEIEEPSDQEYVLVPPVAE
jgi:hypothetical protein